MDKVGEQGAKPTFAPLSFLPEGLSRGTSNANPFLP